MPNAGRPPRDPGNANLNQDWQTLEALGNWAGFRWDPDGGADGWVTQTRTHNAVNELTDISGTGGSGGTDWIDPVHDAAGNMIGLPS